MQEAKLIVDDTGYTLDEIMKAGYQEMAEINLKISELCFCVETEAEEVMDQLIAESE